MRLSADKSDQGFDHRYTGAKVMLDGIELRNCVTADEEQGECLCLIMDTDGRPKCAPQCGSEIETEIRRGDVKIVLPS